MKALIVGATGLTGHSLWRDWTSPQAIEKGWKVSGTFFKHALPGLDSLDIRDSAAVESCLNRIKPEVIVLAAANPFVDYCETHQEETRELNMTAMERTAGFAKSHGAKVVFFSTEYVFPGQEAPYDEEAEVKPLSEYGEQKVAVERWMEANLEDYLVLRVSGVYGWALPHNRKNFVMQVLRGSAKNKISAATDIFYNPTYAPNLGPVLAELLDKNARGIYHAAGEQKLSRYAFAKEIVRVFDLDPDSVRSVTAEEFHSGPVAKRPTCASLNTDKLKKTIEARLWAPKQALEHMKKTEREWNE